MTLKLKFLGIVSHPFSCVIHRFIENDLRTVNRTHTPWVVVNQHRPIYTSSVAGRDQQSDIVVATDLRNAMEDLFFLFQVTFCTAACGLQQCLLTLKL